MKKNIILLFVLLSSSVSLFAQAPSTFKYQAVVRDTQNNIDPTHNIGIRSSILEDSPTGICVYSESFNVTTSAVGLINLNIGGGTPLLGAFAGIDWSTGFYWIKLEVDMTGGTTYTPLGTPSQLVSVPYAKFADRAGKAAFPAGMVMAFAGDTLNIPDGWLLCDGAEISRNTYADLFTAISIAWGAGDMTNTFNLPDMRGTFLRGVDYNKGNDPDKTTRTESNSGSNTGNAVGSMQGDAFQGHWHNILDEANHAAYLGAHNAGTDVGNDMTFQPSNWSNYKATSAETDAIYGTAKITSETRPKNVYVNYIIKY